jgi:hypothetical protein
MNKKHTTPPPRVYGENFYNLVSVLVLVVLFHA